MGVPFSCSSSSYCGRLANICSYPDDEGSHLGQVVEINCNLVLVSICNFPQKVHIFQRWLIRLQSGLPSSIRSSLVLVVHEVILVAQIVLLNVHVAEGIRESGRRSALETLEELLKSRYQSEFMILL